MCVVYEIYSSQPLKLKRETIFVSFWALFSCDILWLILFSSMCACVSFFNIIHTRSTLSTKLLNEEKRSIEKHFDRILCFYHVIYWYRFIFKWFFRETWYIRDNRFCCWDFENKFFLRRILCLLFFLCVFVLFCFVKILGSVALFVSLLLLSILHRLRDICVCVSSHFRYLPYQYMLFCFCFSYFTRVSSCKILK